MRLTFNITGLLLALGLAMASGGALGQSYPIKGIKLVLGYPPSGGTDTLARIVAQKLTERFAQPVIVENRPGANAIIGVDYVAKAAPDGYTLLVASSGEIVFNPGLYAKLPYDPVKDIFPIMQLSSNPQIFAVHPSVPATTIKELIALAKEKPGKLFYASGATAFQVATELFKKQAGVDIALIPYKGTGQAITAVLAGDVAMATVNIGAVLPYVRAGRLRAIAVSGSKRTAVMPEVPTMGESGQPNFEVSPMTGLFAPSKTPKAITDKLYSEVSGILKLPDVLDRFSTLGVEPGGLALAEFGAQIKSDIEKWAKVSREANIRAE